MSEKLQNTQALTDAAKRALAEAEERRRQAGQAAQKNTSGSQSEEQPKELGGQDGPDPVRYGDWEKGGLISDF